MKTITCITMFLYISAIASAQCVDVNRFFTADQLWQLYDENFPKLQNMNYVWNVADLHSKQSILRQLFNSKLQYYDGCYRTAYLLPMFSIKALILKEKKLLLIEQPKENSADFTACAPERT